MFVSVKQSSKFTGPLSRRWRTAAESDAAGPRRRIFTQTAYRIKKPNAIRRHFVGDPFQLQQIQLLTLDQRKPCRSLRQLTQQTVREVQVVDYPIRKKPRRCFIMILTAECVQIHFQFRAPCPFCRADDISKPNYVPSDSPSRSDRPIGDGTNPEPGSVGPPTL